MASLIGVLPQALDARRLDLGDLIVNQPQPGQVVPQLGQGVGRQRHALGRAQLLEPFCCLAQARLEPADAQPGQRALHPVADPGALADQGFPLAARPPGALLLQAGNRRHRAVAAVAAQPTKKGALQQRSVQAIGPRPSPGQAFARQCSRDTAMLVASITRASTPRACNQRASQNPSRPAS
jgi:hypothetical protein